MSNQLIGYVQRNGLAKPRAHWWNFPIPGGEIVIHGEAINVKCGKCERTENVARMTYVDEQTGKESVVNRCEKCLESGLKKTKPKVADEVMEFARRFVYKSST